MTLGCARHTAALYDRGGQTRVGPLDTVVDVNWQRKRDDISQGSVRLLDLGPECRKVLADAEPGRHELVIFRDQKRVWEGPVTSIEYGTDYVGLEARDVMHYAYRLITRQAHDTSGYDPKWTLPRDMKDVLVTEFARREAESPPINVTPYIRGYLSESTATTNRVRAAYSNTVWEEIDDIARYAGCDYVVIGRSIILSDVHTVFFQTPPVSEADFLGPVIVSAYGMQLATYNAVTNGEGEWGEAGGEDPYYGHWETLYTATAEEGEELPDDEKVFARQAASGLVGLNPVPFVVRVPDGSQLNPEGALSIDDLVPGARIPLRATMTARTFSMMLKLDEVKVTESAGSAEAITITCSTASKLDEPFTGVLP